MYIKSISLSPYINSVLQVHPIPESSGPKQSRPRGLTISDGCQLCPGKPSESHGCEGWQKMFNKMVEVIFLINERLICFVCFLMCVCVFFFGRVVCNIYIYIHIFCEVSWVMIYIYIYVCVFLFPPCSRGRREPNPRSCSRGTLGVIKWGKLHHDQFTTGWVFGFPPQNGGEK